MTKTIKLEAVLEGAKYWEGGEHKRSYINIDNLLKAAGWKIERYGTGSIKSAYDPDGDKVSNNKTWKLCMSLHSLYYDHVACRFNSDIESALGIKVEA